MQTAFSSPRVPRIPLSGRGTTAAEVLVERLGHCSGCKQRFATRGGQRFETIPRGSLVSFPLETGKLLVRPRSPAWKSSPGHPMLTRSQGCGPGLSAVTSPLLYSQKTTMNFFGWAEQIINISFLSRNHSS